MPALCNGRHIGPFSLGTSKPGQYRCENCGMPISGVEVYLDATEHSDAAKIRKHDSARLVTSS